MKESRQPAILVVEDNPTNQLLIKQQLRIGGFKATITACGKDALAMLEPGRFDVVLTDINMPDMDGFELTSHVRNSQHSDIANMPVIAITAAAIDEERRNCLNAGMDDFLTKPVDLEKLKETIYNAINRNSGVRDCMASKPDIEDPVEANSGQRILDISIMHDFVGSDRRLIKKLLETFSRQTAELINAIHIASRDMNLNEVKFHAHKLKSSARSVGALKLADISMCMETAAKQGDSEVIVAYDRKIDDIYADVQVAIQQYI